MKKALRVMGWIALGILLLISFCIDLENISEGGSIDLRNRVTGVRLLLTGVDPYHYKWDETKPEIYADPYNNPHLPVSKTTSSPALLFLSAPFAALPYGLVEFLWLAIQWILLFSVGWIWWLHTPGNRRMALVALFIAFSFTAACRLHVERGQAYLVLLAALAGWISASLRQRSGRGFWAGLLAGGLIALRPSFLFLLPFVLLHRRAQIPGAIAGLLLGIGLPLFWDPACWTDYFSGMKVHAFYYVTDATPAPGAQHFPATIEGIPIDILGHYAVIPYADFSIYRLIGWMGFHNVPSNLILAIPTLGFAAWLWLTRKRPWQLLLPGLVAWLFLTDLFLPAYRNSYNDVLALNLLALCLVAARISLLPTACLVLAIPIGGAIYFFAPEAHWIINLSSDFLALGAILLLPPAREGPVLVKSL